MANPISSIEQSVVEGESSVEAGSGENLSVENSRNIFASSSSSSSEHSSRDSSGEIRISFHALLSRSEKMEHKEKKGYFISHEMVEKIEQFQSSLSHIVVKPPPNYESFLINLSFLDDPNESSIDKSNNSIQRLQKEQREQIELLQAEKRGITTSSFEKKEKSFEEFSSVEISRESTQPHSQTGKIQCTQCHDKTKIYKELAQKYNRLKRIYKQELEEKEKLKQKVLRAGDMAKPRD